MQDVEFNHKGKQYQVAFERRHHKTNTLIRRGILQKKRSQKKQATLPKTLQCTHCTILREGKPVASGMSVCSPNDKFDTTTGKRMALRKTIARSRAEQNDVNLDKDWAVEAWQALFDAESPNPRAARVRKLSRLDDSKLMQHSA